MHLVIVRNDTIPTHVIIRCRSGKRGKHRRVNVQDELIYAQSLGEELTIVRSLFLFTTPTVYDIVAVRDEHAECLYGYDKSKILHTASHWLIHDVGTFSFDNVSVVLDSAHLTLKLHVGPGSKLRIEDTECYSDIQFYNISQPDGDMVRLRP